MCIRDRFATYIVNNGEEQPILMIKANRELVYYYDIDDYPPYSFVGGIGGNTISIRTDKYEYTLEKVILKQGYKLEISIDENHYSKYAQEVKIKRNSMPDHLNYIEKNLIRNSILVLKNHYNNWFGETGFTQEGNRIHFIDQKKSIIKIGPFRNKNIQFYPSLNRGISGLDYKPINFAFEPGFSYQITPDRDRLYEYDFKLNKKLPKNYR